MSIKRAINDLLTAAGALNNGGFAKEASQVLSIATDAMKVTASNDWLEWRQKSLNQANKLLKSSQLLEDSLFDFASQKGLDLATVSTATQASDMASKIRYQLSQLLGKYWRDADFSENWNCLLEINQFKQLYQFLKTKAPYLFQSHQDLLSKMFQELQTTNAFMEKAQELFHANERSSK